MSFLLDLNLKKTQFLHEEPYFPLKKYGYVIDTPLNNRNRWTNKIVCSVIDEDCKRYVSTTYTQTSKLLKLIKATAVLNRNDKLCPKIIKIFSNDNTVICGYIGELLTNFLLNCPDDLISALSSVYDYLKELNFINQKYETFKIPVIVKNAFKASFKFNEDFEFLNKSKTILSILEKSTNKFLYGYGIDDPHIWNFRVVKNINTIQAFTTDFDYFKHKINYFWELGYFYASFRWLKKISFFLAYQAEQFLLNFIQDQDLKSKFMFWLGVLSSYCGYRDSLLNSTLNGEISDTKEYHFIIKFLDSKIFNLAKDLL